MALTVETGSGISGANSYYSLASAKDYFTTIGIATFVGADTTLEANLVRACYYMETLPWKGLKALSTNSLEWPRRNIVDKNGYYISATAIPLQIKQAQAELALRYLNGDEPVPDLDNSGRVIRQRVDVIEIEYDRQGMTDTPQFPYIDYLLAPYLKSYVNVEVVRT